MKQLNFNHIPSFLYRHVQIHRDKPLICTSDNLHLQNISTVDKRYEMLERSVKTYLCFFLADISKQQQNTNLTKDVDTNERFIGSSNTNFDRVSVTTAACR